MAGNPSGEHGGPSLLGRVDENDMAGKGTACISKTVFFRFKENPLNSVALHSNFTVKLITLQVS